MEVQWTTAAKRELRKLDRAFQNQVFDSLDLFVTSGGGDVRRYEGARTATFRLRSGDYRILLGHIDIGIEVLAVGNRREAFR